MNEQLPFKFRYTVDELSLEDYLFIYRTLDEDEYPIVEVNGKKIRNNYPLDKDKRTEGHMKNLQQKVVRHLTDLPVQKLAEDVLIEYCMKKVAETFLNIESLLEQFDPKYSVPNFEEWTFIRWIELEQRITKGYNVMDGQEVVSNTPGVNWILPMTCGEYTGDRVVLQMRYDYFLKELPLKHSLQLYRDQIKAIENIKSRHTFLYGGSGGNSGPNLTQHFNIFGWAETLRSLVSENQPFGTYKETKESPLFEVLEFLNINSSYMKAQNADQKAKTKR